jgi:hypothetical protein
MRVRHLLVAFTMLVATGPPHADDHGLRQLSTGPPRVARFPYASVVNGGVEVYCPGCRAAQFRGGYASVWP